MFQCGVSLSFCTRGCRVLCMLSGRRDLSEWATSLPRGRHAAPISPGLRSCAEASSSRESPQPGLVSLLLLLIVVDSFPLVCSRGGDPWPTCGESCPN